MVRLFVLIVCSFFSTTAFSVPLNTLEAMLPAGSQLALSVYNVNSGQQLVERDDDILLPPASTQKVVTALAASLYLPSDFSFETKVLQSGKDIVFKFGGDPTLKRKDLQLLVSALKAKGINQIRGDVWLDGEIFTGYERAVGWPWDILGVCYSAPSSAISLERNCVQGSIYSNKGQRQTRVFVPEHQPIEISTDALAVTKAQQQTQHCDLELNYNDSNHYQLSGCLVHRSNPLPLKFAIQNPQKYVSDVLAAELRKAAITVKGNIRLGSPTNQDRVIAVHKSAPRDALLNTMLKRSDNLIADNILKTLGHRYFKQPGSFSNGAAAIKAILKQQTNIDLNTAVIVDGSGLSRNNRMTATQLMSVIQYVYSHPQLGVLAMLPVSGVDGTLKYRSSVRHAPLKNKLTAKTGSLYGSYNLAGILKNNQGQDVLVVQLVTNYHIPKSDDRPSNVASPITQFERELYQALLTSSLTTH
ncbi:serine-type D-Ala-D-Ala carboxypeptidase [Enterovibrio sp. ZSDZ42]|uniref:Serine-type D-Ala-D-Ala carboxypeptidase n=1 Tax=Enterovibrio gelatinilyticus TaxID=2899819 RepID=A0ABT5R1H3_9GAMM|nr:serine-type D-Ala-D-Ala carboxypeptidase [Enterovibrio sp. ZSDZ42]MDD1794116.1 serine-type D-Ala-D-Ala carboxypeptidase [Enterovibrio sp. ZSDZ42]